jgi:hypothetical protein
VVEHLVWLPVLVLQCVARVAHAARDGGTVGALAGGIAWFVTGKPFTSFLHGLLWAGLATGYVLITRTADDGED